MSLTINQSVTVTGQSIIEGTQVIYFNASVSSENEGNTTINQSIQNQELYRANRVECRKDADAFQKKVREVEDDLLGEIGTTSK